MSYPISKDDPEYPIHKSQWAAAGVDIERTEDDLPPYKKATEHPIAVYHCSFESHDFRFLRRKVEDQGAVNVQNEPDGAPIWQDRDRYVADVFFCTKCLIKREVPA